ncbi:hypothetical protein L1085_021350 [Streptomyces sp. MSC1_001]|uniref:hypothetical protein n=1 Tax=Streptomyces sp. MSC1_001 TaxID=2909263 RepID=UPI00202F33F5|nr:hypothetical protein [Streptomyces sp. MSC1_001]
MSNPILWLVRLVLGLLLPPSGRRRSVGAPPPPLTTCGTAATTALCHTRVPLLRGEDSRLVRPYLDGARAAARGRSRAQRQRRRALWLAVHGVDVGPRLIHGVEVA